MLRYEVAIAAMFREVLNLEKTIVFHALLGTDLDTSRARLHLTELPHHFELIDRRTPETTLMSLFRRHHWFMKIYYYCFKHHPKAHEVLYPFMCECDDAFLEAYHDAHNANEDI